MLYSTLTDLDELVRSVRAPMSASYVEEAIRACQSRSYRAAIIATWVAVAYDLIEKIREMAADGDAAATTLIQELEAAIANKNLPKLQQIENSLLDDARDKFELLSQREHGDLDRLKDDRNLCAHPAFVEAGRLFTPEPELVRTHIVHAVKHLLSQSPIQGKAALNRIKNDMLQPSFPTSVDGVQKFLDGKYLNRARSSLLDTLVTVLLKALLRGADPDLLGKEPVVLNALLAISNSHPSVYERKMAEQIPRLTDMLDDSQLKRVFRLLDAEVRCWRWLSEATRMRMEVLVKASLADPAERPDVMALWDIKELKTPILEAFERLSDEQKEVVIADEPRPEFAEEAIKLYAKAGSFRRAESRGNRILLPMASAFTKEQVAAVLEAIPLNRQISFASDTPRILSVLFDKTERYHQELAREWQDLVKTLVTGEKPASHFSYPRLREKMAAKGMWPPPEGFDGFDDHEPDPEDLYEYDHEGPGGP